MIRLRTLILVALLGLNQWVVVHAVQNTSSDNLNYLRQEVLIRAIHDVHLVTFSYRGHLRTVEPHACGVSPKAGAVLFGYQTEGSSASRPPPGWRTFALDEIQNLVVSDATFPGRRDGYSAHALKLEPLWAELPPADSKPD